MFEQRYMLISIADTQVPSRAMQRRMSSADRPRLPVLADTPEEVARTLVAQPARWFRIAGSELCRQPDYHAPGCKCAVRVLTQTAYRVREKDLRGFADVRDGCFEASALSAANRPDRLWPVEIKARYLPDCPD